MTHLYLIRHGEAQAALDKRIADQTGDSGLSPLGRTQAARLRDRLAATGEIAADVLIASTYPRARETAEILAPVWGLPILPDPEVQELRVGEADGLTRDEFNARYGRPNFEEDPFRPVAPGGESWAQFNLRIVAAFRRITREHAGRRIVVVCHGWVINGAFVAFFDFSPLAHALFGFYTHNTAITEWRQHDQRGVAHWRLVRYNDDFHLREHVHWAGISAAAHTGVDAPSLPVAAEDV